MKGLKVKGFTKKHFDVSKRLLSSFLLVLLFVSSSIPSKGLLFMGSKGAASSYGLDAVLENPAMLTRMNERYFGGAYFYGGESKLLVGYLEPGLAGLYRPSAIQFKLFGGLTWLKDLDSNYKNQYYYTLGFGIDPVFLGVNLIYKQKSLNNECFGMDIAMGAEWFERLTTTLVAKNLLQWTLRQDSAGFDPQKVRLCIGYDTLKNFRVSFDAAANLEGTADFGLGAEFDLGLVTLRGLLGADLDLTTNQTLFEPGLGLTYRTQKESNAFRIDLALNYKKGKVGHSASFGYLF